jgi:hypothetical protein
MDVNIENKKKYIYMYSTSLAYTNILNDYMSFFISLLKIDKQGHRI